jgi:putative DNA primase/helicase
VAGGAADNPKGRGQPELVVRRVADVETVPVEWLWKDRIALGKITFIVGDPDEGKSYLATALVASVTRRNAWPDGAPCERGSVILISAEDDIADTIRPRLEACGADLDKVHFIETVNSCKHGRKVQRLFSLQEDLDALAKELKRISDVRLVEIDPISAFLGDCDSHVNAEVRGLMGPLAKLAAKHNAAFLGISHLNKGGEGNVLYRIMGSLAFVALARGTFLLTHDRENPERRLLLPIKNNLSGVRTGLAFSLVSNERGLPVLAWEEDAVDLTASEALAPSLKENNETKLEAVKRWLRAELADAPAWEKTIEKNAKALNISIKTLRRAKGELDIKSKKQTFSGKWAWFLPTHSEVWPPSTESAPDKPSSQDGQRPPSTETKRDANLKAAPDKDSSQAGHCPPSDEAGKNAPPGEDGQSSLGVGKIEPDYEEGEA